MDSPEDSTSIDVCFMPRQTNGIAQKSSLPLEMKVFGGILDLSLMRIVRREKKTIGMESPDDFASIDVCFMPRQTNGIAQKASILSEMKVFGGFSDLFLIRIVCRERTTIGLDSPDDSASIDVCFMPRQTNGIARKASILSEVKVFGGFLDLSLIRIVCRERKTIVMDSPDDSASIDVCFMSRQTNGQSPESQFTIRNEGFWRYFGLIPYTDRLPRENNDWNGEP